MAHSNAKITALAGGIGAAKLLLGFSRAMPPENLTIIVNTGDDAELHGLTICPDLDTVTYTLAGVVNIAAGWGVTGDTFAALEWLGRYGRPTWFNLGDRDLATHIHRSALLGSGHSLSAATDSICRALGGRSRILPMSDQPVRTVLETDVGRLAFQEYFVREKARPRVQAIHFESAATARPAPGVTEAIASATAVVICPSNPLISIGPILAVPGIREALRNRRDTVCAVSPVVAGKSLKGPTDKMLAELGLEVSALGVARLYADFAGQFIVDESDSDLEIFIEELGMRVTSAPTVMHTDADKQRLAEAILAGIP